MTKRLSLRKVELKLSLLTGLNLLSWLLGAFLVVTQPWTLLPVIIVLGTILGASGLVLAHELGHRKTLYPQVLSWILIVLCSQLWWPIEHNKFHHRLVGTSEDAATARYNETLYHFLPRLLWTSLKHCWQESKLIAVSSFIVPLLVAFGLSLKSLNLAGMFVGSGLISGLLLAIVNYIEHYGLYRVPGTRVTAQHSWSSTDRRGTKILLGLTKHPDHHLHPAKTYRELEDTPESPRLPGGYWKMIGLALWPSKWFNTINPLVPNDAKYILQTS